MKVSANHQRQSIFFLLCQAFVIPAIHHEKPQNNMVLYQYILDYTASFVSISFRTIMDNTIRRFSPWQQLPSSAARLSNGFQFTKAHEGLFQDLAIYLVRWHVAYFVSHVLDWGKMGKFNVFPCFLLIFDTVIQKCT